MIDAKMLTRRRIPVVGASILILGLAYKDYCPSMRNTRAVDIVEERVNYYANAFAHGWTLPRQYMNAALYLSRSQQKDTMMQLFWLFAHQQFVALGSEAICKFGKPENVRYDIKNIFPKDSVDAHL